MGIVEVRQLAKRYPSFELKDVSFDVGEGKITGFVGRNGAGKTTTIKSMLGLIHADGGDIRYFGLPLAGHEQEIKKEIGYSTGTVNWYARRKIRDIARTVRGFYDTWDEQAYQRYMGLFGLEESKAPIELSEGMKVKFNLMLALSHRAKVLILDEPTSGLDPFSRNELLDVFAGLKQDGVAVFFSTHIISDLEKCADDIVYISKGKIVSALPKEEFTLRFSQQNETLEDTLLRMERGNFDA